MEARTRPEWVPNDLYPFQDRWADINGNLVHYVDEGEGPPLLLLSGNPSWSFGYREIIKRLRHRFRCLAVDYPGFGLSKASPSYDCRPASHSKVIEALVDELGVDGITLMGYDWGGPIGLGVAGRRPEKFRAFVIGNTWAWPADRPTMRFFSALMGGPLSWLLIDRFNLFVNVLLPGGVKRRKLTEQEMAAYRGPFPPGHRRPIRIFPREIVGSRAYLREVESNLSRISDRPALILWADQDPGFKAPERKRFEATFARHRTIELVNVGHNLEEDAPDEIAAAIAGWWDEVVSGSAASGPASE